MAHKRGYLVPVDANPNRMELNGYPVDLLYRNLAQISARSITVVLDACFSGETPKGMIINSYSAIRVSPKVPGAESSMTVLTAAIAPLRVNQGDFGLNLEKCRIGCGVSAVWVTFRHGRRADSAPMYRASWQPCRGSVPTLGGFVVSARHA